MAYRLYSHCTDEEVTLKRKTWRPWRSGKEEIGMNTNQAVMFVMMFAMGVAWISAT